MDNNERMKATRAAVLCIVVLASHIALAQDKSLETIHGAPTRLSSPDDWSKLRGLTQIQRVEIMLTWLIEERKNPTPTFAGRGGGPIDSNYQQTQIVHTMANSDPRILRWLFTSRAVKSTSMRELLGLALGVGGDMTAKPHMIRVLQTHSNPYMRELAAKLLDEWQSPDVVAALERAAATDPFRVRFESADTRKGIIDGYPVRDTARNSLQNITSGAKPNDWSKKWTAMFNEKILGYDEFVEENESDLKRLAKLVNTDKPARRRRSE